MLRLAGLVLGLLAIGIAAGCTGDESGSTPSTTAATGTPRRVAIYLARDRKVAPVPRTVPNSTADPLHSTLLELARAHGRLSEREQSEGYETSVPPTVASAGTSSGLDVVDGVARVALWEAPLPRMAQAQVVYTLTRFPDVKRVVFVADGRESRPFTRKDFEDETPQILVESPLPGDSVTSPIRLRGTANVFEATVSLDVRDDAGKRILQTFTTATSGTGTRGTFDTMLPLPGREGTVMVVAYEASAKDGRPLHVVEVPLKLEP